MTDRSKNSLVARAKDKARRMQRERQSPYARILAFLYLGEDPGGPKRGAALPPGTTRPPVPPPALVSTRKSGVPPSDLRNFSTSGAGSCAR